MKKLFFISMLAVAALFGGLTACNNELVQPLGLLRLAEALAQGQIKLLPLLHDPAPEMQGTGHLRLLPEQHAQMLQLPIILRQHTGCQRRAIGASVIRGFTVADIDAAVLRKIGIQRNVQQSALPGGCHARQPVHRRHDLPTARDAPQCATALGHQKTALGQKG